MVEPPALRDVLAAARRLHGVARHTPLLSDPLLDRRLGGRLLVKPEVLQLTGSFKFRGAYNALATLRPPRVVAWSSGNHAQGVALAASLLGIPATIVMPATAPEIKRRTTEALGAEVVLYDPARERREEVGAEIARRTGAVIVRPYDEPLVIAGQGTVGLEIVRDLLARSTLPDLVLVPCGGGGLTAGIGLVLRALVPHGELWTVEPEGFDDTRRSLEAGVRLRNEPGRTSICDALLAPEPGELTFALNRTQVTGGLAVSDAEVEEAMRTAFDRLKLVVEPGGAVALAAVLAGKLDVAGRTVVVVLSGGNVDRTLAARVLAAG
ncbi:L-threonine dehydratase catabolic TdcB [bacterium HR39]|nr:L-threonine dehydratase catabolic TdcB [bacterium HR39]